VETDLEDASLPSEHQRTVDVAILFVHQFGPRNAHQVGLSRDDVLHENTPSIAAATLNEDRMLGRRSRRSELKLIRGANSFYSVQLCDIDCVCCRNATALRRRSPYPN
jgi:hypothetical protein